MRLGHALVHLLPLDRARRQTPEPFFFGSTGVHRPRGGAMAADQVGYIEAGDRAVNHHPIAADHHPVGAMRAAQHQRGQRIAMAGKAQVRRA